MVRSGGVTSALGVGLLLGSVTTLLVRPARVGVIVCGSSGASMVFLAGMAANLPLAAVAATAVVAGAASTIQVISWTALIQIAVPVDQIARTTSVYALITTIGVPVAYLGSGPLAALAGVRGALWVCIAVEGLAAMAAYAVPDVRRLTMPHHQ